MIRQVLKRDGQALQSYDSSKIANAVRRAWAECGEVDEAKVENVVWLVEVALRDRDVTEVEKIQDVVEVALMRVNPIVAKAYILYRQKRAEARSSRCHPDPLAVSSYVHAGKYARYLPEKRRREVYLETVERDKQMHLRRFPALAEEIEWAFGLVAEKKLLPSMRSFQFAGRAIETNNARGFNCSFTYIDRPRSFAETLFLLLSGCGVGYSIQFEHVDKLPPLRFVDEKRVVHHVVEDTIEGWADALDALFTSYVEGYYLEISYSKIRPVGSPLRMSGGRAPGHLGLKKALKHVRDVLRGAEGRKLRPIECHRILCHAADAVLSGGVRRSAMISLFSLEDSEMMYAKTGDWFKREPWFANANNSVMLKRDDVKQKQFKRIFQMTREFGEPGFVFCSNYDYGGNPCFEIGLCAKLVIDEEVVEILDCRAKHGKSRPNVHLGEVYTGFSFCNLCELNGSMFKSIGDFEEAARAAAIIGTLQAAYTDFPYLGWVSEVIAEREALLGIGMTGMMDAPSITLNPEYQRKVATKIVEWNREYAARIGIRSAARTTAVKPSGCRPQDSLTTTSAGILTMEELFANHEAGQTWCAQTAEIRVIQENGRQETITRTFDNGEARIVEIEMNYGLVVRSTINHPWFVHERHTRENGSNKHTMIDKWVPATELKAGDVLGINCRAYRLEHTAKFTNVNTRALTMRAATQVIKQPYEMDDDLAWLFGYLWGDGAMSVSKYRIRFVDGNRDTIKKAQRVIVEKFGLDGSIKELEDRDAASLEIASKHLWLWLIRNGVEKYAEGDTLDFIPRCVRASSWRHIVSFAAGLVDSDGCVSATKLGSRVQVSSATESFARHFQQVMWAIGLGFSRSLQSQGESFQEERHLYHLVLAAAPTDRESFAHLCQQSVKCGMHTENPDFVEWQLDKDATTGRQIPGKIREIRQLGVMPTFDVEVKHTHWFYDGAVKSHNTTSLELGCVGSGHHAHHARRYIRRITANETEAVFQFFREVNPHMCVRKPNGDWVIEFPVEAPSGAVLKEDLTAIQFLEMVKSTQQNWVLPGTARPESSPGLTHNVSNTVQVKPAEWDAVADYLWENRESFTGVSLLPASGDKDYAFAPNEAITTETDEARWNQLLAHYKPVDYSMLIEEGDTTEAVQEPACAGGACEVR